MTELMVMLVDESETLSEDVIEMTLEQIQKVMEGWRGDMDSCPCTDMRNSTSIHPTHIIPWLWIWLVLVQMSCNVMFVR